jgi:hypothetical protein
MTLPSGVEFKSRQTCDGLSPDNSSAVGVASRESSTCSTWLSPISSTGLVALLAVSLRLPAAACEAVLRTRLSAHAGLCDCRLVSAVAGENAMQHSSRSPCDATGLSQALVHAPWQSICLASGVSRVASRLQRPRSRAQPKVPTGQPKVCWVLRCSRWLRRLSQAFVVPIFHSLCRICACAHRLGSPPISPRLCANRKPTLIYTREPQELSRDSGVIA